MKRVFDLVTAFVLLVVLAPILIIVALVALMTSGRPILFRQERVGLNDEIFTILKFRTMRVNESSIKLTSASDPRITRFGKFLRNAKIDELPQLLNVIAGDMSIVGPRPELAAYLRHYPPDLRDIVVSVRPGITDPASVAFLDEAEQLDASDDPETDYINTIVPVKAKMYVDYINSQSLAGDVRIVLQTAIRLFESLLRR